MIIDASIHSNNMALRSLFWLILFVVPAPSLACPKKCLCSEQGNIGSSSYKKVVDCAGKLGDLDGVPWNIPVDATHLILKDNRIEQLSVPAFQTLTKLVTVDLSNNRLTIVPSGIFNFAPGLKEVYLSGNQLTCDCKLYGVYNASRHLSAFTGSCYKPDGLRDRSIKTLKLWDFCRGCASVKASTNAVIDGEYFMQIGTNCDTPVRFFCRGMNTDFPTEYITLVSDQKENFAYVDNYKQPYASKDDCIKASGGSTYTEAGLTRFSKVRLDLSTMNLVADDFHYSSTNSGKKIKYGEAGDCYSASKENCRKGKFKIDLRGTGFRLKEDVYWEPYGTPSDIKNMLDIDEDRRRVLAECGGYCGGCRARGGKLTVEVDYCQEGVKSCYKGLGMEDRSISDSQITASSYKTDGSKTYKPEYGRLNNRPSGRMGGAWCADKSDTSRYLQIDLRKEMTLSGISTQGQSDQANWVVMYSLEHSKDGTNWLPFKEFGKTKDFEGNVDQNNVVTHWFNERFRARFVKIVPKTFSSPTNTVCMRVELYGCDTDVASVVIRSSTTKNCWSPQASSNPCDIGDGTLLSLQSYCQGEGVMLALLRDGTIVHSCSGKCVYRNAQGFLALRDGPCDTFTKRENPSGAIVLSHQASGLCVNLDATKKLTLSSCNAPYLFEVTQSGLQPIAPKFKMASPQYLTVDKPGWVHCKVASDPRAKFFWSKAFPWPNGERLDILEFAPFSNGSLFVRKAKKSYEDDYYCVAVNSAGYKMQGISVKVGEPPAILEAPKNLEISVNRTARFDCKASSGSKITWFKQVQGSSSPTSILKLGRRFNVFPNGSLKIHLVQKVDEAFYRCRAENFIGYNHARAFLRVLVPPRFTIMPRGAAEPSGSSPVYNCQAAGDPVPTIRWTKVGSVQSPTEQLQNGSLRIRNIQKADEGRYACSASNSLKTIKKEITISVYTACRIDPQPHAVRQPNRLFFAVGGKVVVRCKPGFETKQDGNLTCQDDGNWDKNFPQCTDINECAILASNPNKKNTSSLQSCHEKARCVNTAGSYRCQCIKGYAGTGFTCVAVCMPPTQQANGEWTPEKPNYQIDETVWLQCSTGYERTDQKVSSVTCGKDTEWSTPSPTCRDKNECEGEEGSRCHKNADCINTAGSFKCRCKEGFEGDGVEDCKEEKKRFVTAAVTGKRWKFSAKMDDLIEKMQQFEEKNATAEQLLDVVLNSSASSSQQFLPGDLVVTLKAMRTALANMNVEQKMSSAKPTIQITSNLLDKRNKDQWSEIQKNSKGVTDVMSLLDEFAMELAADLEKRSPTSNENATIDVKTDNVEMRVMVKEAKKFSSDFQYPERAKKDNEGSARIRLSKELFGKYKDGTIVKVTSFFFKDLAELMPKRGVGIKKFDVSSPIVSSSLSPSPSDGKLDPPVRITLTNQKPAEKEAVVRCVYWDFERSKELGGSWSSDGCRLVSSASNGTVCECDHLTSFASLSVYDKDLELTLIIYIGCGVLLLAALISLIRHFYIYCKTRAERSIIHINLCLAIAFGIGLFLGGLKLTKIKEACIVIAALLQYFFIAMFCWAVCEGLQLFMTLTTGKNRESSRLKYFFVVGWNSKLRTFLYNVTNSATSTYAEKYQEKAAKNCRGYLEEEVFPLIAVGISLGVTQLQGYGDGEWCWLDYGTVLMWAYVCPAAGFILVSLVLIVMILCVKGRVPDSADSRKVCLSVLFLFLLILAIAGTWVLAAIYVKHHENSIWQYVFAGACALQGILLLVYCLLDQTIRNFTFHYKIKKLQHKEKRNYYSTTDTVQYYGSSNAVDGKTYTVTRPSIKESNTDLRGSSKRLSRIGSTTVVHENDPDYYPSPIMDTPAHMDSALKRHIEGQPIPDTPAGEVIHLQTFPFRKGSSSHYSSIPSESASDRRPDGAEEPDLATNHLYGERRSSRTSMIKSSDTLSSHSKLQQIPERQPLMSTAGHPQEESPPPYSTEPRHRPYEVKKLTPFEEDTVDSKETSLDSSRRKSRRSRRRLEEEFGKPDRESIVQRKRSLRYSSGFFSGVTVDQDTQKVEKPHASL